MIYQSSNRLCGTNYSTPAVATFVLILEYNFCELRRTISLRRYKKKGKYISYSTHATLRERVTQGFQLSEVVASVHDDLVLVIFYRLYHQYDAMFVLADVESCKIVSCFDSPTGNMSIMECRISPDGSRVAVLFFMRKDNLSPFRYA